MSFAGVGHLTSLRDEFQAQTPKRVPVNKDHLVLGSGVAEIAFGASMLVLPKNR
ncbi:hypothetical protein ACN4DU_03585 [Corynebacterium macclintockiae]|uniref:hypothetical protein n=1 Tax=Corynebacterium macclintockiae TaxID=2913501 RepID=UPI000A84D085